MKEKDLIEIYSNEEDSFSTGYKIYEDRDKIFLNSIDDQGRLDGYLLIKKNIIEKIEKNTDYLKKLEKYRKFWGRTGLGRSDNPVFKEKPDFKDLISYAYKNKKILSLATSLDYYDFTTGLVTYFDENLAIVQAIDQNTGETYEDFDLDISEIVLLEVENIDNLLLEYIKKK